MMFTSPIRSVADLMRSIRPWRALESCSLTFSSDGPSAAAEIVAAQESEIAAFIAERTADLARAAQSVTPLAKTAQDKITKLREWAKGKARPATAIATEAATNGGRQLDV